MKVCGLEPGPKVGQILERIFHQVSEETIKNDRKVLLSYLKHGAPKEVKVKAKSK